MLSVSRKTIGGKEVWRADHKICAVRVCRFIAATKLPVACDYNLELIKKLKIL